MKILLALLLIPSIALAGEINPEDGMLQCGPYGFQVNAQLSSDLCDLVEAQWNDEVDSGDEISLKDARIAELEDALIVRERLLTKRLDELVKTKRELKQLKKHRRLN